MWRQVLIDLREDGIFSRLGGASVERDTTAGTFLDLTISSCGDPVLFILHFVPVHGDGLIHEAFVGFWPGADTTLGGAGHIFQFDISETPGLRIGLLLLKRNKNHRDGSLIMGNSELGFE